MPMAAKEVETLADAVAKMCDRMDAVCARRDAEDVKKFHRWGGTQSEDPSKPNYYNPMAVQQAIEASNRAGRKIGKGEAKLIHSIMQGWRGRADAESADLAALMAMRDRSVKAFGNAAREYRAGQLSAAEYLAARGTFDRETIDFDRDYAKHAGWLGRADAEGKYEPDIRRNWGWHAGRAAQEKGRHEPWVKPSQTSGHPSDKMYGEGYWAGYYGAESPSKYDPITGRPKKRADADRQRPEDLSTEDLKEEWAKAVAASRGGNLEARKSALLREINKRGLNVRKDDHRVIGGVAIAGAKSDAGTWPISFSRNGTKYESTGKEGKDRATGLESREYEAVDRDGNFTGSRVWRTSDGTVRGDAKGGKDEPLDLTEETEESKRLTKIFGSARGPDYKRYSHDPGGTRTPIVPKGSRKDAVDPDTLKKGDKIKENRQGAEVEEVLSGRGNMIDTYGGKTYHSSKVVRADDAKEVSASDRAEAKRLREEAKRIATKDPAKAAKLEIRANMLEGLPD